MANTLAPNFEDEAQESTRDCVRDFAAELLRQGNTPQEVGEEMAYIAVEMSLHLAHNKQCVVPILMSCMARAALDFETSKCESSAPESGSTKEFEVDEFSTSAPSEMLH